MADQSTKLVLVGCGNMGFAMLRGWLEQGALAPGDVHVVEPTDGLRAKAADKGVHVYRAATDLPETLEPNIVILAVKPQVMDAVTGAYARYAGKGRDTSFVSVAAGVPIGRFEKILGTDAAIVRVMPNTPAAIGQGMMVLCANPVATQAQIATVERLMAASGKVARIDDEALMDAVTAISGSGPAYLFHLIEALRDAARAVGLPDDTANELALQTVYGAASYARQSAVDPATLREQVTSPNGTTAAALAVLMRPDGLSALVQEAVRAARDRSVELGQ